jgi:hypothetical protein
MYLQCLGKHGLVGWLLRCANSYRSAFCSEMPPGCFSFVSFNLVVSGQDRRRRCEIGLVLAGVIYFSPAVLPYFDAVVCRDFGQVGFRKRYFSTWF